jgi:hypothetical protein
LVKSNSLDAVIFVGLILPVPANNNEQKEELVQEAAGERLATVTITGGSRVGSVAVNLLDYSARPQAVAIGLEDGARAANALKALMSRTTG